MMNSSNPQIRHYRFTTFPLFIAQILTLEYKLLHPTTLNSSRTDFHTASVNKGNGRMLYTGDQGLQRQLKIEVLANKGPEDKSNTHVERRKTNIFDYFQKRDIAEMNTVVI